MMDLLTLYSSFCIHGSSERWADTMAQLCDCGITSMHLVDLVHKLKTVAGAIDPGTDAKSHSSASSMHNV